MSRLVEDIAYSLILSAETFECRLWVEDTGRLSFSIGRSMEAWTSVRAINEDRERRDRVPPEVLEKGVCLAVFGEVEIPAILNAMGEALYLFVFGPDL